MSSIKQGRVLIRGRLQATSASRVVWGACTIALCASCASGAPQEAASTPRARERSAALRHDDPARLRGASWRRVALPRFALAVPLPEFSEWRIDDESEHWFVARHPASKSELRVRAWSANRSVTPNQCETQARLWLPSLPAPAADDAVEIRRLRAPSGYHGELIVGVRLLAGGAELEGYALAFGATVGRCYASVFTTRALGPEAEERVGSTLAVIAGGLLERVEVAQVEDRAPHPEFPF